MTGGVDLHAHTTASDGALTPRELVRAAARRGLRVLAITDHDSMEGVAEAVAAAAAHPPLVIVPGLEINCDVVDGELHVLGYGCQHAGWFADFLRGQRAERVARVRRMTARLTELGLPIEPDEVLALVKEGAAGRPHVAQAMVRRGYVRSTAEAFDRYLRVGGPAHVPRHRLAPAQAVAVIRRARGVPVLAHPGVGGGEDLLPELLGAGLMGIEAYHPEHSAAQTARYLQLCRKHRLVATGGSDYHGERAGRPSPLGHPPVPMSVWEALKAAAAEARAA